MITGLVFALVSVGLLLGMVCSFGWCGDGGGSQSGLLYLLDSVG